jgi:hypothetical protein
LPPDRSIKDPKAPVITRAFFKVHLPKFEENLKKTKVVRLNGRNTVCSIAVLS